MEWNIDTTITADWRSLVTDPSQMAVVDGTLALPAIDRLDRLEEMRNWSAIDTNSSHLRHFYSWLDQNKQV